MATPSEHSPCVNGRAAEVFTPPLADRLAAGKALRQQVPRSAHAIWSPPTDRPDPIELLETTSRGRVPHLIPIRYARMAESPFAFLRGAAAFMACDLAATPTSGIPVQLCGDCHLANFGTFATPERNLLFDISDFDETLPGPWEWDVKRLAASFHVAGRSLALKEAECGEAVVCVVRSYRQRMREYASMRALELWYAHIDARTLVDQAPSPAARKRRQEWIEKARERTGDKLVRKITEVVDGRRRFRDDPPLMYHLPESDEFTEQVRSYLANYRATLPDDRRFLVDHYKIADVVVKVVGVGSVGTRCAVALLMAAEDDPLFLQVKEARPSVLEPYLGKGLYPNNGQRIVAGQRMMQSASDLFLGWLDDGRGRDYYIRQLRDMKWSVDVVGMSAGRLREYGELCGWALARAHARSGDAALIAGYLGRSDAFDKALAVFAAAYADQTERDHEALVAATRDRRVPAEIDRA